MYYYTQLREGIYLSGYNLESITKVRWTGVAVYDKNHEKVILALGQKYSD